MIENKIKVMIAEFLEDLPDIIRDKLLKKLLIVNIYDWQKGCEIRLSNLIKRVSELENQTDDIYSEIEGTDNNVSGLEEELLDFRNRLVECEMKVSVHRDTSFTEREAAARILKMDERIEALEKLEHNDGNDQMLAAAKFWHKRAEEYRCKYINEKQQAEHWCKESQKLNAKLEFIEGELKTNKIIIKEGREANEKLLTDNRNYVKGIERLKQQIADRDKTIAALREQMHKKCGCPFGSLT